MYEVSKVFSFEAAHSLPHLPEGHKCRRPHGHSYRFEVVCRAESLDERGFVVDYGEISEAVDPLVARLDHRDLNFLFDFPTTAEHLARWLYDELLKTEIGPQLHRIDLFETAKTRVSYPVR